MLHFKHLTNILSPISLLLVVLDFTKKSRHTRESGMKKHNEQKHKSDQHKRAKKQKSLKSQTCSNSAANSCPNGLNPYDISNIDITLREVFLLMKPFRLPIGSRENQQGPMTKLNSIGSFQCHHFSQLIYILFLIFRSQ